MQTGHWGEEGHLVQLARGGGGAVQVTNKGAGGGQQGMTDKLILEMTVIFLV